MSDLFDFTNDKPQSNFKVLPAGEYPVTIDEAELKETRDGSGKYIKCVFRVFEGEAEGQKIFFNFNIENKSEKATQIGRGQMKRFIECAMIENPKLSSPMDLVGYKVIAKTKVRTDQEYGDKAEITSFYPYEKEQTKKEDNEDIPF